MYPGRMSLSAAVLTIVLAIFHNSYVKTERGLCGIKSGGGLYETGNYTRLRPKIDNKRYVCCPGYRQIPKNNKTRICIPIPTCNPSCGHGECVKRNKCNCDANNTLQNGTCVPICKNPCLNAICIEPDKCQCLLGYKNSNLTHCEPYCSNGCENGICEKPETCKCNEGWYSSNVDGKCYPLCENGCINSTCIAPNNCKCSKGYEKAKNSNHICKPKCSNACSHGMCVHPEICVCNAGWYWNNSTSSCEYDKIDLLKHRNNWFGNNWQWMVAAMIILIATVTITLWYMKHTKNKESSNDGSDVMAVPEQEIRMNILRRAKIHI